MIEQAICLWCPLQENSSPPFINWKTKMDRLYALEDSVKSLFWKNSKPIRTCVLGSTSRRNLRALPSRSALGCASGTTLRQRSQVSMLGRTSDAAPNINGETRARVLLYLVFSSRALFRQFCFPEKATSLIKTNVSYL